MNKSKICKLNTSAALTTNLQIFTSPFLKLKNVVSALLLLQISVFAQAHVQTKANKPSLAQITIQSVLAANEKAQDHMEWHLSGHTPEDFFASLRAHKNLAQAHNLCAELSRLDNESLTLFENEIRSQDNNQFLKNCSTTLKNRLEQYWSSQRALTTMNFGMGYSPFGNPVFDTESEPRDLSRGYKAIDGELNDKTIMLTFDDGPHPIYTPMIIETLAQFNAKVMFFHVGRMVQAHPRLVQEVASHGHAVGSHSFSHLCLAKIPACKKTNGRKISYKEATTQIVSAHQAIFNILKWVSPFFRFPYGASSKELSQFLADRQTGEFFWNIDSWDWKKQSNEQLLANTLKTLEREQKGIILFHDIQRRTAEILPIFLAEVHRRGYKLALIAPMDERQLTDPVLIKGR